MEELNVDFVVIGTGPAGQKAAIQAAKLGKKVAIIEKDTVPGGACLNSGTIPSKSLREAVVDLTEFNQRSFYGKSYQLPKVSISDLNYRLTRVLEEERDLISRQFKRNNIILIYGTAQFTGPHSISVTNANGETSHLIQTDRVLIATGSIPRNPLEVPFDEDVILDSTRLLSIDKLPKTMIVLGGGIVGSEYASYFAALGVKVTVVDKKDHILSFIDWEIGIHLQTALVDIGLQFVGNKEPEKIEKLIDRARVTFKDGSFLEADVLLYALGRVANVAALNIEKAGLSLDKTGHMPVNPFFQTPVSHIYAAGDVVGNPALASTSMEQGRRAACHAFGAHTQPFPDFFPIGIYTIPEISSCGYNEEELQKMGFHYQVGRAYYYEIARSHINGLQTGMFKILFHSETLEVLGVHIIGSGATEVIHIGQVAMSFNARLDYFIYQVFNYPTYAEGYRIAALNGLNKVKSNF
ncbi:MAG: Si-specific NAD(P)(+) transhydrogenase [Parachlamydiales bacterium]|nr:Si-specific NAD(P)(+) transhydrogenase [Parachlamydiales bacterium]